MQRHLIALAAALLLAACSGGQSAGSSAAEAEAYMKTNAAKAGVTTLPSGVQYEVVRSGPPEGVRPDPGAEVKVHYEGRFVDGEVFDSSYERGVPAAMPLQALIPAWIEVLQLMRPGDEWLVTVPPEMGYGESGQGAIPPNSVLVFRIELIDVLPGPGQVQRG